MLDGNKTLNLTSSFGPIPQVNGDRNEITPNLSNVKDQVPTV